LWAGSSIKEFFNYILSMRLQLFLLLFLGFALAEASKLDSTKVLRITADIPGSWEQGDLLQDQLESSLNGFHGFQVVPRAAVAKMLAMAHIDPMRRDSATNALVESHFPAPYQLDIKIGAPRFVEERTPVLFWLGRRQVKLETTFRLFSFDGETPELAGDFSVDTVVSMGYCGLMDCVVRPMDAKMRLTIEQELYRKLVVRIQDRLEQLMVIPAEHRARLDSLEAMRAKDSLRSRAMQDSLDAILTRPDTTTKVAPPLDTTKAKPAIPPK
jgi:hypothetical protein